MGNYRLSCPGGLGWTTRVCIPRRVSAVGRDACGMLAAVRAQRSPSWPGDWLRRAALGPMIRGVVTFAKVSRSERLDAAAQVTRWHAVE